MISVAVKGYGIVIVNGEGWRTFAPSDALSATLAARVEHALDSLTSTDDAAVRAALLSMSGAHLLAEDCDHGPGGCDGNIELN